MAARSDDRCVVEIMPAAEQHWESGTGNLYGIVVAYCYKAWCVHTRLTVVMDILVGVLSGFAVCGNPWSLFLTMMDVAVWYVCSIKPVYVLGCRTSLTGKGATAGLCVSRSPSG